MFLSIQDPREHLDSSERSHCTRRQSRSGLPYPLSRLYTDLRGTNWKNHDTPPQGTPTGSEQRNPSASAVAEHAIDSGHAIAWDDASVIDSSSEFHQRCALAWQSEVSPTPWTENVACYRPCMTDWFHIPSRQWMHVHTKFPPNF